MKYPCLLSILILFSSCSDYYYLPNSQNVPILKEKNELQLSLKGIAVTNGITEAELQGAYSPMKNMGVMVNYLSYYSGRRIKGRIADIGIGAYKEFKENIVCEVYGGLGYGKTSQNFSSYAADNLVTVNVLRPFIQPAIGFSDDENIVEIAFSTRLALVNFRNIKLTGNANPRVLDELASIRKFNNSFSVEPCITTRIGWQYVKVQIQVAAIYNDRIRPVLNQNSDRPGLMMLTFGGGLQVTLAPRFRKAITH